MAQVFSGIPKEAGPERDTKQPIAARILPTNGPATTQVVISASQFMQSYWWMVVIIIVGSIEPDGRMVELVTWWDRAADDPRRPAGHRGHESLWARRGYVRRPELSMQLRWTETGAGECAHSLTFWTRVLEPAA